MKKNILNFICLIFIGFSIYYIYNNGLNIINLASNKKDLVEFLTITFTFGFATSAIIFNYINAKTTGSLNIYKRELEKTSIDNTETNSKVKTLEAKIEVLEKALKKALEK